MVQLFEIRYLLENNVSYAQVFTVILCRCHLWHYAISLKSRQMAYSFKTILLPMHTTFLVPVTFSPSAGKIHLLRWFSSAGFSDGLMAFIPTKLVRAYDTIYVKPGTKI